ncbi:MAG TPA: glycosyltransferase family 4 protein, partial [Actinomycetota bacterium]|nr:glycosyltransferase family 4 protein [Actinomycetota bacterium]
MTVLRLCSVFEPPPEADLHAVEAFDPIGGMQNHTAELTRVLDGAGVKQRVITTRPPGGPRRQRVGTEASVLRLGFPVTLWRQLYALPAGPHVAAAARNADLVHVHIGEDLAIVPLAIMASRLGRIPMVLTIHCSMRHTLQARGQLRARVLKSAGSALELIAARRAGAVIVITERLKELLKEDGIPAERIHVIPSGVKRSLFRGPFKDPAPELPRPRVLFVGRLAPQKGLFDLMAAVPRIDERTHILLVGDGPDRRALEKDIRRRGLGERVHITGFVRHDCVPSYLAHADVLVLPSRYEELGCILVEAMQLGLPMVATRTGGIPEVIEDGRNGFLVPPQDPLKLAESVNSILSNPALARRLGEQAGASACLYDWDQLGHRVLDIYRSVLGRDRFSG